MLEKLKAKFTLDKDSVFKWGFLLGAGVLSLIASIFDTRKKDRQYSEKLDREIAERAKKMLESKTE